MGSSFPSPSGALPLTWGAPLVVRVCGDYGSRGVHSVYSMTMNKPPAIITVKAARDLIEQLKPIAAANRRSVAQEINVALEQHIKANAPK